MALRPCPRALTPRRFHMQAARVTRLAPWVSRKHAWSEAEPRHRVRTRLSVVAVAAAMLGVVGSAALDAASTRGTPAVSASTASCASELTAWCTALGDATSEPANVLVIGDSIAEGYWAQSQATRWMDRLRVGVQTVGGEHGLGYVPASSGMANNPPYPGIWTEAGGTPSTEGLGDRSYTIDTPGGFAEATARADRFRLSYTATPGGGAMEILIDGAATADVDTSATTTQSGRTWLSPPLQSGTHTISVRPLATGRVPVYSVTVEGVLVLDGADDSGVRVWDASHAGYTSASFVDSPNLGDDVAQANPDLLVVELGTNDMSVGIPPGALESNLESIIDTVKARDTRPVSVVVVPVWDATIHDPVAYRGYVAAELAVARSEHAAVDDLSAVDARLYTVDGAHPNSDGAQLVADTLLRLLVPIDSASPRAPTGPASNPLEAGTPFVPAPPQSVSVTAGGSSGTLDVRWAAPDDGSGPDDYFTAQVFDVTAGFPVAAGKMETGGRWVTLSGLTPGHRYAVEVESTNTAGSGPESASVTVSLP